MPCLHCAMCTLLTNKVHALRGTGLKKETSQQIATQYDDLRFRIDSVLEELSQLRSLDRKRSHSPTHVDRARLDRASARDDSNRAPQPPRLDPCTTGTGGETAVASHCQVLMRGGQSKSKIAVRFKGGPPWVEDAPAEASSPGAFEA